MRNLKLIVEYKGTDYSGFQKQPSQPTIQGVLEEALSRIIQEEITVIGAGRTDAGVHAKGQVVNFYLQSDMEYGRMRWSANSLLPPDIVITEATEVNESFHARRNARSREYRYLILNRDHSSPFWNEFAYFFRKPLDIHLMREAAKVLEGEHDFSSFCAAESKPQKCIRKIEKISIYKEDDLVHLDIKGNAFLHNMVRIIVGTLLPVGTGEMESDKIRLTLKEKSRKSAGPTVPACGLFLMRVNY